MKGKFCAPLLVLMISLITLPAQAYPTAFSVDRRFDNEWPQFWVCYNGGFSNCGNPWEADGWTTTGCTAAPTVSQLGPNGGITASVDATGCQSGEGFNGYYNANGACYWGTPASNGISYSSTGCHVNLSDAPMNLTVTLAVNSVRCQNGCGGVTYNPNFVSWGVDFWIHWVINTIPHSVGTCGAQYNGYSDAELFFRVENTNYGEIGVASEQFFEGGGSTSCHDGGVYQLFVNIDPMHADGSQRTYTINMVPYLRDLMCGWKNPAGVCQWQLNSQGNAWIWGFVTGWTSGAEAFNSATSGSITDTFYTMSCPTCGGQLGYGAQA